MERLLLGLVWSEVTVTAVQEGNLEGMVLQILLKVLFHLKQGLQWGRSAFSFQRNGGRVCVVVGVRNIEFWTWKGPLDSCVNLLPLTHSHPPLPYMSWNLEETIGRAPDGALGDLETVLALRPVHCVTVGKTFLGFLVFLFVYER